MGRQLRSVGDYEDALPGAFLSCFGHCAFELRRDGGHLCFPAGLVEDGVALFHVGQAIVAEDEHRRTDLAAKTVPCTQLLVDPHVHERFISSEL